MNEDLYFIPILDRAFRQAEPEAALKNAFDEIKHLGKQKQYREGLSNFRRFMGQVYEYQKLWESDSIYQLIAEIATGSFDGTENEKQAALKNIASHPEFRAVFETVCRQVAKEAGRHDSVVIQVFSQKKLIGEMAFTEIPARKSIEGILPGSYMLKLDVGRVIWQGNLTGKDLVWTEAFGARRLDLAAETEDIKRRPARRIVLLDGDVILCTFAGIESGSIEIELTK